MKPEPKFAVGDPILILMDKGRYGDGLRPTRGRIVGRKWMPERCIVDRQWLPALVGCWHYRVKLAGSRLGAGNWSEPRLEAVSAIDRLAELLS